MIITKGSAYFPECSIQEQNKSKRVYIRQKLNINLVQKYIPKQIFLSLSLSRSFKKKKKNEKKKKKKKKYRISDLQSKKRETLLPTTTIPTTPPHTTTSPPPP